MGSDPASPGVEVMTEPATGLTPVGAAFAVVASCTGIAVSARAIFVSDDMTPTICRGKELKGNGFHFV